MNRRLVATVLAVAAVAGLVGVPTAPPRVTAEGAGFDPRPGSASFGTPSAFPSVVASGTGRYHAVARTDGFGQYIQHRVSENGGISWQTTAMLATPDGGGTRPRLAADGDTVAISFIGVYCTSPPTVCGEAPFLAVSRDGGRRFNGPVRLDTNAFDASVAVAGDDVWVTWEPGGSIEVRGTSDAGATFPISASYPSPGASGPEVSAAGSTVVVAWDTYEGPRAVIGRNGQLGTVQPLGSAGSYVPWRGGATAVEPRGAAHVVVYTPTGVYTRSAAPGAGSFGPRVDVFDAKAYPTISARDHLVAVGLGTEGGTAYVTTSTDGGATFSGLEPVATMPGGISAAVTVAKRATDRPQARFDWSVPERYPADANGRRAPALTAGSDQIAVDLDGCESLPPSGGTIEEYRWTLNGADLVDTDCTARIQVENGDTAAVRLEVTAANGTTNATISDITPVDHLIVSMGDSIASGEGNPHADGRLAPFASPTWSDRACHRSDTAGPARAAAALEDADPRSSVTFIHLACSGASMLDTPDTAGGAPSGPDDETTGGVLDPYEGIEALNDAPRPAQIDQMIAAVGSRSVDALLVSVGANDIRLDEVVKECIVSSPVDPRPCHRSATASSVNARFGTLPGRYAQLAGRLGDAGVPAESVYITEYLDPTVGDLGLPDLRCIAESAEIGELASDVSDLAGFVADASPNPLVERIASAVDNVASIVAALLDGGLVTDDETTWARTAVIERLNQNVQAAAGAHGWNYVGGIAARFDRHGYCAADPWVVRLGESLTRQHDRGGAFQPDANGHEVYGDAIEAAVGQDVNGGLTPENFPVKVSLGDVYVTVSNGQQVWASIVRDTGGVPELVDLRSMDQLRSGDGYHGPGFPAADEASAVTPWWQVSNVIGGALPVAMLGQITLAENIGVRSVTVAQAPVDGTVIVAGRESVVLATIDARIAGSQTIDVTTEVIAESGSGGTRTVHGPTTQQVTVVAGRNDVLLPVDDTFTIANGEKASANVTVSEAIGPGGDPSDDFATSTSERIPTARESRALVTTFLPADVGGSSVSCASVGRTARRMASYASDAMPVAGDGIAVDLACTALTIPSPSEPALLDALAELDHLARLTAKDAMVAVVPEGWLRNAAEGAVGVAVPGLRAVLVEGTAPAEALAHEIAHSLGVLHRSGPAEGVRISTRTAPRGVDWMNPFVAPKMWTAGVTWDKLLDRIGSPLRAPRLPDPAHLGVWVRGTVEQLPNGDWVVGPATWTPASDADPGPAWDSLDELQLERMTVEQRTSDGTLIDETEVPIEAVEGIYGADPGAHPEPIGGLFATRIDIDPAAAALRLVQGGVVIEERTVGAAPTVTVTAPLVGATASRGSAFTVTWSAADADSPALTADILISGDGTEWQPLAVGIDAGLGTTELPVPADLDGTDVRVRVVVSDGVRSGMDDSDPFTVDGGGSDVVERVAFSRDSRIFTMAPDGTEVTPVDLPTEHGYDLSGVAFEPVQWRTPHLGTDGRIYVAGNYVSPLWEQAGDPLPSKLTEITAIFSSLPDGSDLRRVSRFGGNSSTYSVLSTRCPQTSPDGTRLTWSGFSPTRPGPGQPDPNALVVANTDGTGQRVILTSGQTLPPSVLNDTWFPPEGDVNVYIDGCPRWSPDGTRIAVLAGLSYRYTFPGRPSPANVRSQAVPLVIDVATGAVEVLADQPRHGVRTYSDGGTSFDPYDYWSELDWLDDVTLFSRLNESSGLCGFPFSCTTTYTQVRIDAATGVATRLGPVPNRWLQEVKVAPGGEVLYGSVFVFNPTGPAAYDLGVYDPAADSLELFPAGPADTADIEFDWGFATVGGGPASEQVILPLPEQRAPVDAGGPYQAVQYESIMLDAGGSSELPADALVEWDLDGDGLYGGTGDALGVRPEVVFDTVGTRQIRARFTAGGVSRVSDPTDVAVSAAPPNDPLPPVPGVDGPTLPALPPTDVSVTIPAGSTTAINLQPTGARLAVVDEGESAGLLVLGVPRGPGALGEPLTTDPDGVLLVSPAAGFLGTTSFTVASPLDVSLTATVTVTVVGNVPPVAGDDTRSLTVGQVTTFASSELLRNDVDPDGSVDELRVVAVRNATNGDAWIDPSGTVFVAPDAVGDGAAEVVVVDAGGALATSRLLLSVVAAASTTTTEPVPSATVPAGTVTAGTVPTATLPAATVPATPVSAPPSGAATPPTTPDGGLPATGSDIVQTGRLAALALLLGCAVVAFTKVRRRATSGVTRE